jgi:ankyrin repeat protein
MSPTISSLNNTILNTYICVFDKNIRMKTQITITYIILSILSLFAHAAEEEAFKSSLTLNQLQQLVITGDMHTLEPLSNDPSLPKLINRRGMFGRTTLYLATSPEILEWLLRQGADPSITNDFGDPILLLMTQLNQQEKVGLLLRFGADPKQPNAFGNTALREAHWRRNHDLLKLLNGKQERR